MKAFVRVDGTYVGRPTVVCGRVVLQYISFIVFDNLMRTVSQQQYSPVYYCVLYLYHTIWLQLVNSYPFVYE
jgi:hypothetical protein